MDDIELITDADLVIYDDSEITLPYRYRPRHYQQELIDAFFDMLEGKSDVKNFIACWHRRAGKDVSFFQLCVAAAVMERGDYYYLMPAKNQAKRTIFKGNVMDSDGVTCGFTDFIPPSEFHGTNTQDLEISLTNGSRIIVGGSDHYDNFVGGNAKGVVWSEYSLTNPAAREFIRPMIKQNNGWELFCFTPRGKNHAFDILNIAQKEINKDRWFVTMKSINETTKENGEPVVSPDEVQYEIDNEGLDENIARQEYYLDFNARVAGVVYGKEMERARKEGRIRSIDIDPDQPIITFWDIGISRGNAMAVWCMQPSRNSSDLNMVAYFEAEDEPIAFFLTKPDNELKGCVNEWTDANGLKIGDVYFPHDGKNREVTAGQKRHEEIRSWGYKVHVLERTPDLELGIRQTKKIFSRINFDENLCHLGVYHLERYRRRIHKDTNVAGSPVHDDSSNCADAIRQMGQFYGDKYVDKRFDDKERRKAKVKLMRQSNGYTAGSSVNNYNPCKY